MLKFESDARHKDQPTAKSSSHLKIRWFCVLLHTLYKCLHGILGKKTSGTISRAAKGFVTPIDYES